MRVNVTSSPLDPWREIVEYQNSSMPQTASFGATAVFVGTMRDFNEGTSVQAMTLEHYEGMTERHLQSITDLACERWSLLDLLVIHRIGDLAPGDPIVLVAAWSAHRADAFAACRFLMEELKSSAPLWKKEQVDDGERWVERNTPASALDE